MKTLAGFFPLLEALIERGHVLVRWLCRVAVLVLIVQVSPILALLAGFLIVGKLRQSRAEQPLTHGSAQWAGVYDLLQAGCLFQTNGIRLGRAMLTTPLRLWEEFRVLCLMPLRRSADAVVLASLRQPRPKPLELHLPDRIPHLAVYGLSGAGKSTCYAAPQLFQCGDSMVVLDSKGELARLTARHRAKTFGHEIVLIDPYGVADGCGFEKSRVNPLALFAEQPDRIVDEARRMASALVVTTGEEKDPFWTQASTLLITAVLAFLMAEAREGEANLNRLRDILTNPELLEQVLAHMQQSDACGGLLRRLSGQVQQLQGQTKASVYSVANSHIDFLDSLPLADTLAESTADPRQLIHGKQTIYVCLPVDRIIELAGVQRVLLSTLINLVFATGEDRNRRVRFLLDEAATLGSMDSLYNALNFGRSYGLRLIFLFQSTSQIERCFPESQRDDFLATVANVFCGVNDLRTAKEVSDWIGQTTVNSVSEQTGDNWGGSTTQGAQETSRGKNWGGSRSWTSNQVGRALIQAEEVLQLPRQAAIVLLPNVRPILAEKVPWFEQRRRRIVRRLLRMLGASLTIAVTLLLVSVLAWSFTIGRSLPSVQAFWSSVRLEL